MPLERCRQDDKPGWRFGASGACYVYTAGDDDSEMTAKRKAIRQGLAIGGGKPPPEGFSERMRAMGLETVDIPNVEIFRAGGPFFGHGSPPGGDHYTVEEVTKLAQDTDELVKDGRLKSPVKIGHGAAQKLAQTLGIEKDELPALGFQENFRVNDGGKVLADWKKVPRALAELIVAGRYPSRSAELYRKAVDGGSRIVFGATSLLGATPPAVSSLAEIAALHADDDLESVRAFALEFGEDDDWTAALFDTLRSYLGEIEDVLADSRDTSDVSRKTKQPTVLPDYDDAKIEQFAAAFEITEDDVEKRREAVAAKFAEAAPSADDADDGADTGKPAGADGGAGEGASGGGAGSSTDDAGSESGDTGAGTGGGQPVIAMSEIEMEKLKADASAGRAALNALHEERVERKLSEAITQGRLDPGNKDKWVGFFSENEERATDMLADLPVNEDLLKVHGHDGDGMGDESSEDALYASFAAQMGISTEVTGRDS